MRLKVNGSFYISKRTKHTKARYFFIKDTIEDVELEVQYYPKENMWTDILNKAEQGMKFCKDIAALMNVSVYYDDEVERKKTHPLILPREKKNGWRKHDSLLRNKNSQQECVGKHRTE